MKSTDEATIESVCKALELQGYPSSIIDKAREVLRGGIIGKTMEGRGARVEFIKRYAMVTSKVCPKCGGAFIPASTRPDGVEVGYCRCGASLVRVDGTVWAGNRFAFMQWSDNPAPNAREFITKKVILA